LAYRSGNREIKTENLYTMDDAAAIYKRLQPMEEKEPNGGGPATIGGALH